MKVDILSDLHVEFNGLTPFRERLSDTNSEVLLCGGDAGPVDMPVTFEIFKFLCSVYKRVVYTPGNHDYYGGTISMGNQRLQKFMDRLPNLEILFPGDMTEINGLKVIGATLWVPFTRDLIAFQINDPYQIPDLYFELPGMHSKALKFIEETVDQNTLVLTHHMPHPRSIAPQYKGEGTNAWFCTDLSALIEEKQPFMWIHGHSHNKADYMVGNTRIINNAYGYPSENKTDKFGTLTYYI